MFDTIVKFVQNAIKNRDNTKFTVLKKFYNNKKIVKIKKT